MKYLTLVRLGMKELDAGIHYPPSSHLSQDIWQVINHLRFVIMCRWHSQKWINLKSDLNTKFVLVLAG